MSVTAVAASPALMAVWPSAALMLVAAIGIACAAWATWGWRREREAAYRARTDHAQWQAMASDWQWQTDAEHCLRLLVPPTGPTWPSPSLLTTSWQGRPLWALWAEGQAPPGLRERLEARAPVVALPCNGPGAADGTPAGAWRLSATPQYDRAGHFRGHIGRLWPPEGAAQAPAPLAQPDVAGSDTASFTYTVSHDLRAPIRVVEGFTRIVKEDYGHLLDRVGLDHLDRVLSAASRMNSMIDALLALSRLSQQPLSRQPVNLSQLAEFVLDDLQRAQPERRVRVQVQPGLTAQGDPTLLRMALENLLGNAWKYTGRQTDPQIRFEGAEHQGVPVYRVCDNGAGFDMRFADRLFGVFQRLHGASEFPGTGVGLASVRRIVQRHGGDIWAESVLGQGSTFHFTLAAAAIEPARRAG